MQHGPAASSGSNPKAPGSAGGYLPGSRSSGPARATRRFLSDYQGRDLFVEAELVLAADGHFSGTAHLEPEQHRRAQRVVRTADQGRRVDDIGLSSANRARTRARSIE
jgi:hypothetical protein